MSEERNELNRVAGSGYLDGFPEPEVAYTRHKALSGSFKCRCVKGAWCYAKGGKRPCDAGMLIPTRPEDLMRIVDRLEAADTLLAECRRYVTAMEDAAAESLGIYDHSKRSKSGIEKRLDYYFENTEH